mgnify:CR=1 FL=1
MPDPTYDTDSLHTPETRDRDARFVGHEVKVGTSKEAVEQAIRAMTWAKRRGDGLGLSSEEVCALLAERDALKAEVIKLREENEIRSQSAALALGEITALRQDVAELRFALRSIANEATWPDALMSDKDIARSALKGKHDD